jgi:hypothetical protein
LVDRLKQVVEGRGRRPLVGRVAGRDHRNGLRVVFNDRAELLGSILRNRFGQNLRTKLKKRQFQAYEV